MPTPDMTKLRAVVQYIVDRVPAEEPGMTRLSSILWLSDREAYLKRGETISGDTCMRNPKVLSRRILQMYSVLPLTGNA